MSRKGLSDRQKSILDILTLHSESTVKQVAETIFNKSVEYQTKEYNTIHRSIRSLEKRGLVERVGGQLKFRITQ